MSRPELRILVAGIGNIFLGDDAFGTEVAQRLLRRAQRPNVRIVDFGIRGLDLVYALLDGYQVAIFIDAAPRGEGPPGTLYLLEPRIGAAETGASLIDGHAMDPVKVLQTAMGMGALPPRVFIVGCEPASIVEDENEMPVGMSPAVAAAVESAVLRVESLVEELCGRLSSEVDTFNAKENQLWVQQNQ